MREETFIAAVRRSVGFGRLEDPGPNPLPRMESDFADDLEAIFDTTATRTGATVHYARNENDAISLIAQLMKEAKAESFLSWDKEHIPLPDLTTKLEAAGFRRTSGHVPPDIEARKAHQIGYFDCPIGITGADAGLAETGSIILRSGIGRPRMASLIPKIHIAVLNREHLWPSLRIWLANHSDDATAVANTTIVTGPSRTADIEMIITHGVHGPRYLHILLI